MIDLIPLLFFYILVSLDNIRPGDCIVSFSKNDLYSLSRQIEAMGKECAVIYGSLPPGNNFLCPKLLFVIEFHVVYVCVTSCDGSVNILAQLFTRSIKYFVVKDISPCE